MAVQTEGETMSRARGHWRKALSIIKREKKDIELVTLRKARPRRSKSKRSAHHLDSRKSLYLFEGQEHTVWKPTKETKGFSDIVLQVIQNKKDLLERQQKLDNRIQATRQLLKEQREELVNLEDSVSSPSPPPPPKGRTWSGAISKVVKENNEQRKVSSERRQTKRQLLRNKSLHFHDAVTKYVTMMSPTLPPTESALPKQEEDEEQQQPKSLPSPQARVLSLHQYKSQIFEQRKNKVYPKKSASSSSLNVPASITEEENENNSSTPDFPRKQTDV